MATLFKLASWNVEHFKGKPQRVTRVVEYLCDQRADVFALYEVEGKEVFSTLVNKMPEYSFFITEGPQTQEILVGLKKSLTGFFSQRVTFKTGNKYLRPGALLTLTIEGKNYTLLFLHTKSSSKPIGLGIRDDMFRRAFKLKRKLDKNAGGKGKANFIFLGDLNTMGMKYPFGKNIDADLELKKIDKSAERNKMRRLLKNKSHTWWDPTKTYPPSDLDHVVISEQLQIRQVDGAEISVRGWPEFDTKAQKQQWISRYSDHALLFMTVEKA